VRTALATRYVTPFREGGSMPGLVEADDQGLYVAKFRGAGQGARAIVAEWIAGELARAAGLRVPELIRLEVDAALGRNEPDYEIRQLLKASPGANLGIDFLPGSITFDPAVGPAPAAALASEVVWFDAFVQNVDRTARNTNLLLWHRQLWLIDHGAALYFHHAWERAGDAASSPFAAVKDHVLLPWADELAEAGARLAPRLGAPVVAGILAALPDAWLAGEPAFATPDDHRAAYAAHLARRLEAAPTFVEEARRARASLV
jgi:hypothetical protein